jgi:hypothetical protein
MPIGWVGTALAIVNKILGLLGVWQAEVHDANERKAGRNEVAAEEAAKIEEARQERLKKDAEVKALPDPELDRRLDKWMRD